MNDRASIVRKPPTLWTFYVSMACISALLVLLGFSRRYFVPLASGTFSAPAILHLHGIITFGWVSFVILQSVLVATGRTSIHRSMGMAGIALGTLLVSTATQVAILMLARELREGGASPREFNATLMSIIFMIVGLFGAAIAKVSKPEVHKRLMVLATFVILTPALARIIQMIDVSLSRLARNDLAGLASNLLIAIALTYDTRIRGKPHLAYVVGGACILFVQVVALSVRSTPSWYGFTNWLARLVG